MASTYQIVVGFRSNVPYSERIKLHVQTGARLTGRIPKIHAHILTVPKGKLIKATFPRLSNIKILRAIELGTDCVPGVRKLYRFGRINALKSLRIARKLARCKKK